MTILDRTQGGYNTKIKEYCVLKICSSFRVAVFCYILASVNVFI